jgi:hypothetical protein
MKITYDPPPAKRGPLARLAETCVEAVLALLVSLFPRSR